MHRLINFIVKEPDFERLTGEDFGLGQRGMYLPETAGGKALFEVCKQKLQEENDPKMCGVLRQVMARNGNRQTLMKFCLANENESAAKENIFTEARDFGLVKEFSSEKIAALSDGNMHMQISWLVEANLNEHIVNDANLYEFARSKLFDSKFAFPGHRLFRDKPLNSLEVLSRLIHPVVLSEYFRIPTEHFDLSGRSDFIRHNFLKRDVSDDVEKRHEPFENFVHFVVGLMDISPEVWRTDLEPWEALVDRGFQEAPGGRLFSLISLISTAVSSVWAKPEDERESQIKEDLQKCLAKDSVQGSWDGRGFTPTKGLVKRLFFAKIRGDDLNWWQAKLRESDGEEQLILLTALVCWGQSYVIMNLSKELGDALNDLKEEEWSWFWTLTSLTMSVAGMQMEKLSENWFSENDELNERLAVVMTGRLSDNSNRREVVRKCFHGYKGGDLRILQRAAEWELLPESNDDIDWEFVMRLSAQARENCVEYLFPNGHKRHQVEVPVDVAKQVLEQCGNHNWQFVLLCERSFGSFVTQNAKRVSTVAEEQNWFDSEPGD